MTSVPPATVRVPLATVRSFAEAIARHDLWNEAEAHLRAQGVSHIVMGDEALTHISGFVGNKLKHGALPAGPVVADCASHTPAAGGTPVSYPAGGGDAGAGDAGAPR